MVPVWWVLGIRCAFPAAELTNGRQGFAAGYRGSMYVAAGLLFLFVLNTPRDRLRPRYGRANHGEGGGVARDGAPRGAHERDIHQYAPRRGNNTGIVLPRMKNSYVSDQFSM